MAITNLQLVFLCEIHQMDSCYFDWALIRCANSEVSCLPKIYELQHTANELYKLACQANLFLDSFAIQEDGFAIYPERFTTSSGYAKLQNVEIIFQANFRGILARTFNGQTVQIIKSKWNFRTSSNSSSSPHDKKTQSKQFVARLLDVLEP